MRKAKRVFLGNSLTANLLAREGDIIVDYWEGGSDLYGWNLGSTCLDRVPIFLRGDCCRQLFGGNLLEVDVEVVIEGSEANVIEKLGDISGSFIGYCGRMLVPRYPVCTYYRELLLRSRATRVLSPISKVDLQSKFVRTYHYQTEYEELVNTLPLHYFLTKSGLDELKSSLKYSSAYVLTLISETKMKDYTKTFVGHRGYSLGYVVSYGEHPLGKLVYSLVPVSVSSLIAELNNRVIAELKRLKLIDGRIRLARSFFVKYFRLGGDTDEVYKILRSYDVVLRGRYGSWMDISLCDICQ